MKSSRIINFKCCTCLNSKNANIFALITLIRRDDRVESVMSLYFDISCSSPFFAIFVHLVQLSTLLVCNPLSCIYKNFLSLNFTIISIITLSFLGAIHYFILFTVSLISISVIFSCWLSLMTVAANIWNQWLSKVFILNFEHFVFLFTFHHSSIGRWMLEIFSLLVHTCAKFH